MNAEDFDAYLTGLGLTPGVLRGNDGLVYTVVRNLELPAGGLAGRTCDVAIHRPDAEPFVVAAAIHTRPALVAMDTAGPLKTQASGIGPEWQYWSRRFDRVPTPKNIWTHVLTVFAEVPEAAAA